MTITWQHIIGMLVGMLVGGGTHSGSFFVGRW